MTNSEFIDAELAKYPILSEHHKKLIKRYTLILIGRYEIYPERALAKAMLKFNARNTKVQYFPDWAINDLWYN
jgi:hypothetical protein